MNIQKILVVDDEELILELCRDILTREGYQVVTASSGEQALQHAAKERFSLSVLDMLMPGMDGLQTFLALRKHHPDLIGVLVTAHGTMETAIQAMRLGFSRFIRKPFTPFELVQAVQEAFQNHLLMEENARLKTLIPLYHLGERFIMSHSRQEVLDELIQAVSGQLNAQRVSIMLFDEKDQVLRVAAAVGPAAEKIARAEVAPGDRIAGRVFQEGKPLILNGGPDENPEFAHVLRSGEIAAAICFPLKARERTLGVINVSRVGEGEPFSEADIEMLSVLCGQAVLAIENVRIMEERAERTRIRTLLEQYVSPEVAEVLIDHGQNPLDLGEIGCVTVLFADIRQFTPLVSRLDLPTLRAFLNEFFDLLSEMVFRHQGTLDKFMGDAALAIFGAPVTLPDPPLAAVRAALAMSEGFDRLRERWMSISPVFKQVGLGIGVTAGEVFLGNVGSTKRFDYTVIGTDVNLAQRLAAQAASGQILLSAEVAAKLKDSLPLLQEPPLAIRGLEAPVAVFSVERPKAPPCEDRPNPITGSSPGSRQ